MKAKPTALKDAINIIKELNTAIEKHTKNTMSCLYRIDVLRAELADANEMIARQDSILKTIRTVSAL